MILYGWVGGQSVLACFLATIIPGIILVILFSTVNLFYAAKNKNIVKSVDSKPVASTQGKKKSSIPALLMPFVILGAIYGGVMTTTEAAALSGHLCDSCCYALLQRNEHGRFKRFSYQRR